MRRPQLLSGLNTLCSTLTKFKEGRAQRWSVYDNLLHRSIANVSPWFSVLEEPLNNPTVTFKAALMTPNSCCKNIQYDGDFWRWGGDRNKQKGLLAEFQKVKPNHQHLCSSERVFNWVLNFFWRRKETAETYKPKHKKLFIWSCFWCFSTNWWFSNAWTETPQD